MPKENLKTIPLGGAQLVNKTTGECFVLERSVLKIGRDEGNDLTLPQDTYVSRHHAWILHMRGQWWVEDLGSTNGTTLNGKPLEERKLVAPGDAIKIGRTELFFELSQGKDV